VARWLLDIEAFKKSDVLQLRGVAIKVCHPNRAQTPAAGGLFPWIVGKTLEFSEN
jgi:hypothetical protein